MQLVGRCSRRFLYPPCRHVDVQIFRMLSNAEFGMRGLGVFERLQNKRPIRCRLRKPSKKVVRGIGRRFVIIG